MEFGSSADGCLNVWRRWRDDITIRSGLPYVDVNLDSAYWYIAVLQPWPGLMQPWPFGSPETGVCKGMIFSVYENAALSMVAEKGPKQSKQAKRTPWTTGGWIFDEVSRRCGVQSRNQTKSTGCTFGVGVDHLPRLRSVGIYFFRKWFQNWSKSCCACFQLLVIVTDYPRWCRWKTWWWAA